MPRSMGRGRSTTKIGDCTTRYRRCLNGWQGDGIVARSVRNSDLKRLLATGLPVVELFADFCTESAAGLPQ